MSVFSAVEGSLKIQGTVSGTDATAVRLDEPTHALKIYLTNPPSTTVMIGDVTPNTLVGSDGITIISGSNFTTIQGHRSEFVSASGSLQSQIDANTGAIAALDSIYATDANLVSVSGHLQTQISSIVADEVEPAITGTDGITVTSGSNATDVAGFRTEFVAASGSLQSQIDSLDITYATDVNLVSVSGFLQAQITSAGADVSSLNVVQGAVLITGTQNTTTQTVGQTITITGPDLTTYATTAYVDSVAGGTEPAIISNSSNLVVLSGSNTTTLSPSDTPVYTSVEATTITGTTVQVGGTASANTIRGITITGTTGQFGGTISADRLTAISGTFSTGITIGSSTTYIYPDEIRTPLLTSTGPITAPTGTFSTSLTISGTPVMHTGITGVTVSGASLTKGQLNFVGSRGGNVSITGNTITFDANPAGAGGGAGTPGGNDTEVQYNAGGTFAGDPDFTFNSTTNTLSVPGGVFSTVLTISGAPVATGTLTVMETDGSPLIRGVHTIIVTTGTLVNNGNGVVTIETGGGGSSNGAFTFTQTSPASTWNINHSLSSTAPVVMLYDTTGAAMQPDDIFVVDSNNLNVVFAAPASGTATLLRAGGGGGGGGITAVVEDTNPALGGNLNAAGFNITNVGTLQATTVTGTTGEFGGAIRAHTGNFAHSLTISGISVPLTGGAGVPGGINTQVQFNDSSSFGGDSGLTYNKTTDTLTTITITGTTGQFGDVLRSDTGNFKNVTGFTETLGFAWGTPAVTGTLVLEEYAGYPFTINSLIGKTGQGTVSATLKVNDVIVNGINDQTWNTTRSTKTATTPAAIVVGDRVSFVVSGTSTGIFTGFTVLTTR